MRPLSWVAVLLCALLARTVSAEGGSDCGGVVVVSLPGYLTSPGYPEDYPPHQTCSWQLRAPSPEQKLLINFNPHFDMEKNSCRFDYVQVWDDGDEKSGDDSGKFCGTVAPAPILSSGPTLHVKFVSDYTTQGAGFSLRYELYKPGVDCSRNFTAPSGRIASPGHPLGYPPNAACVFVVSPPPPHAYILLTFRTFHLEADPDDGSASEGSACKYDHVEVWDGLPTVGLLIVRLCGSKIPDPVVAVTGTMTLVFHSDNAIAKDGFSASYTVLPSRPAESFPCFAPLGMELGTIPDARVSASSSYHTGTWLPQQGRLHHPLNAWTPAVDSNREWIQVDLGSLKIVTAVATQGAISINSGRVYYVTSYRVYVGVTGSDWSPIREERQLKFVGNTDESTVVQNKLPVRVVTRFVRVKPQTWENGIAMRLELYGCSISDYPCSEKLGLMSGRLRDEQITASASRDDSHWGPAAARLMAPLFGWAPPVKGTGHWLQVDLGQVVALSGLVVQGAKGPLASSADARLFVRKFRLEYSGDDGHSWAPITRDGASGTSKQFDGNSNWDMPEVRRFPVVTARYVRLYPERWGAGGGGLRLELLGCTLPGWVEPPTRRNVSSSEGPAGPPCPHGEWPHGCSGEDVLSEHSSGERGASLTTLAPRPQATSPPDSTADLARVPEFRTGAAGKWSTSSSPRRHPAPTTPPSSSSPPPPPPPTPTPGPKSAYTSLDLVLISIIGISSLGIVLGAVCVGLLAFCTSPCQAGRSSPPPPPPNGTITKPRLPAGEGTGGLELCDGAANGVRGKVGRQSSSSEA
ncbi:neuropilin-2-like isoform X2 [Petromyzon marinus]|uniref:Neuropilin-2-like isoform X2 n=1 Tax=Petromyzon marinus TaxID=7757 RepID=A0AAJ7TR60_PETMA|nr:neuropilin-2-like isoform X2 [Petromyzon marinus]